MAISLATLQQRVFDLIDEGSSQYITAQQCTDQINNGYGQLWSKYVLKQPTWFETDYAFTPVVNTRDYALPTNCRRVLKVYALPAPGTAPAVSTHVPLCRTMSQTYMGQPSQWSYYYPTGAWIPTYDLLGNNIRLDPTPTVTPQFQIAVWYEPHYVPLVSGTDTLDAAIWPGHEQFIVLQAAIMLRMGKEEQPADDLMTERARIEQIIDGDLSSRDAGTGKAIVDVEMFDGWVH